MEIPPSKNVACIVKRSFVRWLVVLTATPGKCSGLTVSDITKNACRLRWKPPEDDGGSRITHYVVERQEVGKPYWTTIASFAKVSPPQPAARFAVIQGLKYHGPLTYGHFLGRLESTPPLHS